MSRVVKELDEAERQQMEAQADRIAETPHPQVDVHSGREFVFVVHFDGTSNDKDNVAKGERQTNVANLDDLMLPHAKGNEHFVSFYRPGVGTQNSGLVNGLKASISPSGDMRARAQEAYDQFREDASDWLDDHPDANPTTDLKVMATGFSRGGVSMAIFSQMLYEDGLVAKDGKILVPPGTLGLSGGIVYDPVSKGYKGNAAFSPTSQNITEIEATSEYRRWFKDVNHDADPNVSTVAVMGNHRNIGGGHNEQGISARVLEASREWFAKTGLPLDDLPEHMRYRENEPVRIYEERDLPGMDNTRKFSGSKLVIGTAAALAGGGVIKPLEVLIPKGIATLAGKADYPRTHNPRNGLDAPRQQRPSARHQEQMSDGWQRFEGVEGVVWSKDAPGPNPSGITRAVMAERNPKGRKDDRIDLYLIRAEGEVEHQQSQIPGGRKMRRLGAESRARIDQALEQPVEPRVMQEQVHAREHKTDQQLQHKVEQRLQRQLDQSEHSREIKADGEDAPKPVSGSSPRQAAATTSDINRLMAQAFKADPEAAFDQYPGNLRISAAKATLDKVRERYAGSSMGDALVKKMRKCTIIWPAG